MPKTKVSLLVLVKLNSLACCSLWALDKRSQELLTGMHYKALQLGVFFNQDFFHLTI